MKQVTNNAPKPAAGETAPTFAVTIFYNEASDGRYGKRVFDLIRSEFADDSDVRLRLWRLDLLQNPNMRNEIRADVAAADLLILAAPLSGSDSPDALADLLSSFSGITLPEVLMLDSNERLLCDFPAEKETVTTCGARIERSRNGSAWRFAHCS